jgi:hypothetical protein
MRNRLIPVPQNRHTNHHSLNMHILLALKGGRRTLLWTGHELHSGSRSPRRSLGNRLGRIYSVLSALVLASCFKKNGNTAIVCAMRCLRQCRWILSRMETLNNSDSEESYNNHRRVRTLPRPEGWHLPRSRSATCILFSSHEVVSTQLEKPIFVLVSTLH